MSCAPAAVCVSECAPVSLRVKLLFYSSLSNQKLVTVEVNTQIIEAYWERDYNVRNVVVLQITSVLFHDFLSYSPPYWVGLD